MIYFCIIYFNQRDVDQLIKNLLHVYYSMPKICFKHLEK